MSDEIEKMRAHVHVLNEELQKHFGTIAALEGAIHALMLSHCVSRRSAATPDAASFINRAAARVYLVPALKQHGLHPEYVTRRPDHFNYCSQRS